MGYRSLKVIQTGTIRKLGCSFLFAFHSNYGSILHQFPDKEILVENRDFYTPLHSMPPLEGWGTHRSIAIPFGMEKLHCVSTKWTTAINIT